DRLIRLEERVAGVEKEMALFREQYRQEMTAFREQYQQEMAELKAQLARMENRSDMQFYTLLTILVGFIAFLLWDRRKALAPVESKVAELQKDSDKLTRLVQSLREYARTHPDLAEILRRYELV
ncbi:MAG: hypothetical protein N2170_09625, partial [Bacteroidia bacterium]|nr:hypothetical protein [Bacteroidia bacterium]